MPPLSYPPSPRYDHTETIHNTPVPDPYRWLEELDAPATQQWIAAQNAFTEQHLSQIGMRQYWKQRLTELWDYEKFGVPFTRGERVFFTRNDGLQNQSVLYWLPTPDAEPRVLLDPNTLSDDGTVALTGYTVSDDGRLLAYGLSASGSDWQQWRVRAIDSGVDRDDLIEWVKFSSAAWTPDHAGFFYSRYDAPAEGLAYKGANYYHKLFYHRLGTAQAEDTLIYQRPDQKEWGFNGDVTDDGRYLVITVWRGTHRENGVLIKDLHAPDQPPLELLLDFDASYNIIGNDGTRLFVHTDRDAPLSRIIAIDLAQPAPEHWREIVPQANDALQYATLVGQRLIAVYLHDAHSRVLVCDLNGALEREVDLPGIGAVSGFGGRQDDRQTYYHFTGFTTPGTVFRYDLASGQSTVFREPRLRFDPDDYVTEQVFYPSKDGTPIPMFLSYKRGLSRSADTPTFLYGYGGFNISLTPVFSPANLAWMEGGGVYAQANLRGGGEYGKAWHEAGTRLRKQTVFDDFIAAAEWLIAQNWTSPAKLAIGGGSNGGLLVGACLTQRPDLFGACWAAVGVLDMLRFHTFTIGWAWTSDYGSPDDPDEFAALLAYSPYHNARPGTRYPPTIITTGDHDDRVFPAHSFKFAAALQHAQSGPAPILARIETRAGHGMGKPTSKLIEERADVWAFFAQALGIES
jgi:prolyl oligopeptidase